MKRTLATLTTLLILGMSTACGGDRDHLARLGADFITLEDLDASLLLLPESARSLPPGMNAEEWVDDKLERAALQRALEHDIEDVAPTPGAELLARSQALVTQLQAQLAQESLPTEAEVEQKLADMGPPQNDPRIDFQHIFFRTDQGASRAQVRARAQQVLETARGGADFSELAREHSASANAHLGGLVQNAVPRALDSTVYDILSSLDEGAISDIVESRTGLHIFRLIRILEPEPATAEQQRSSARNILVQSKQREARAALVDGLRESTEVQISREPWQVGDVTLTEEILDEILPSRDPQRAEAIVEQLLLAAEASARGLDVPAPTAQMEGANRLAALERAFHERRAAFDAKIPEETLSAYYDDQPELFSSPELRHFRMIFVGHGRDSFATQQRLEKHVERLRSGADFETLAKDLSEHPTAAAGGDLGFIGESELVRYGTAVAEVGLALERGQISDPIYCTPRVLSGDPQLLRGGFAILELVDLKPRSERSFEEARDDVRRAYSVQYRTDLDEQLKDQILHEAGYELLRLPDLSELSG